MSNSVVATLPDDESETRQFLAGIFGFDHTPANLSHETTIWKFFDSHPWCEGPRSYVLRTAVGIAAHGCISPVRFLVNGETVESMQVLDWAASRTVPGGGLKLYRYCMEAKGASALTVGGSEDTLNLIPRIKWFRPCQDVQVYGRSIRPLKRFSRSARGARDLARLLRNLWRRWRDMLPRANEWNCRAALPDDPVFMPSGNFVPILRTRPWFDYLLRCPALHTELVTVEKAGVAAGHAFLADTGGLFRVADFVLGGETSHDDRTAAFSALTRYVFSKPQAIELAAASSLEETCAAFRECGLQHRGDLAVYVADLPGRIPDSLPLEITPVVGDAFYLFDPAQLFSF
jgi:hypothetical protein